MWNYVVSAHKPTCVTHSVVGHFTSPSTLNLIISKTTRIEVHSITPDGLQPMLDFGIYGRISSLQLYRPPGSQQDFLFILTQRHQFCVLSYNSQNGQIITQFTGDVQDRIARESWGGQIAVIDPDCRLIGLHMYDGLFKIIPIDSKGQLKDAVNIRLEENHVIDMKFLVNQATPLISILYKDQNGEKQLKTYEISLKDKSFPKVVWSQSNLKEASMLIPVPAPLGGVLIISTETITYQNGEKVISVAMNPCVIRTYEKIDPNGSRYLLGDQNGTLCILLLDHDGHNLRNLKLEYVGETNIPSTISYLDNGVVYIGSTFGDSQLIKLNDQKNEDNSYIEVIDSYTSLGPITDFCVVDLERQGQGQIVTCSGAFKNGSLRVVRNGIGINEQAQVGLPGIKGMWSLRPSTATEFDKYIVLSFIGETRVLAMSDEELEETEVPGFSSDEQTIYCKNVVNDQLVQITSQSVNLVNSSTLQLVTKWKSPSKINVASCTSNQIVLGIGGGVLIYLEVQGNQLKEISKVTLEHDISCVNINPLGEGNHSSSICAVGMWTDFSVRILEVPSLKQLHKQDLGGEIIARSLLLITFEGIHYLLCGLGDGNLFSFVLHPKNFEFSEKKKISLGTQPITLNTFQSNRSVHVFAASDRPTVIYSSNKKLLFSNVNLKDVNFMCPFNSENFPESLAIASEEFLSIGTIDEIQKLHIRTIALNETPRRISHQPSTNNFLIITVKTNQSEENGFVKLMDDQTFEITDCFDLKKSELPCSTISCSFLEDDSPYFVVGTSFIYPTETDPTRGRILIFQVIDTKLKLVSEMETKGVVYALSSFNGRLLAGINSKVHLFNWIDQDGSKQLVQECVHSGHILALYLASRGEFIVVGDLMKSISLLLYKPDSHVIEEIARDYNSNWMSAVEILDEDIYIGAENSYNLFTVKRNAEATTDEDRAKLDVVGLYHLGDFVNKFQHGSLVMKLPDSEAIKIDTMIFGTVGGAIGVIASIPADFFSFLSKVQENLNKVVKGIGGFKHEAWRSFSNERKTLECRNFLDGDLIETFLELKPEDMKEVVKGLNISVEELSKKIELLQRAIH